MGSAVHRNDLKTRRKRRRRKRRILKACVLLGILALLGGAVLGGERIYQQITEQITEQRLARLDCPDSLKKLLERNPETRDFVLGYASREKADVEIDLSDDVKDGEIPLFLQWDKRWGYETYGDDFLAVTGCGPTCLAMVRCGLGGDTKWDPYAVACMAQQNGYYVDGSGSSWELMSSGAEKIGLISETVPFDEEHILAYLNAGQPIICSVGAGDFTTTGHFIVLCGTDADGKLVIHDPNSRKNSEKTWDLERIMGQIKNLWGYRLA